MGKNKNKNKQKNAFGWFIQELIPQLRKEGHTINCMADALPEATPRWERMSHIEREPYERIARQEKARSKGEPLNLSKRDNRGNLIADKKDELEEITKRIDKERKDVFNCWPEGDGIKEETFVLVSFQYLCVVPNQGHLPLEVGMVQFSMKDGIKKVLHQFINPGPIPLGFRYDCTSHSESTHQIPISGFSEASDNYAGLWVRLENFVNPNNEKREYPPIYCLGAEMQIVESCMDWLHVHANLGYVNRLHKIYHVENMLVNLFARTGRQVAVSSAIDTITTTRFDHTQGSWCKYHEEKEVKHCALGVAKRYAFAILDSLSTEEAYDYPLTPNHMPQMSSTVGFCTYTLSSEPMRDRPRGPPRQHNTYQSMQQSSGPFPARDVRLNQRAAQFSSAASSSGASNTYNDDDIYDDDDDTATIASDTDSVQVTSDARFATFEPSAPTSAWGRGALRPAALSENRFAGRSAPPPVEDLPRPQGWADDSPNTMRNPISKPRCLAQSNPPKSSSQPHLTLEEAARQRTLADQRPSPFMLPDAPEPSTFSFSQKSKPNPNQPGFPSQRPNASKQTSGPPEGQLLLADAVAQQLQKEQKRKKQFSNGVPQRDTADDSQCGLQVGSHVTMQSKPYGRGAGLAATAAAASAAGPAAASRGRSQPMSYASSAASGASLGVGRGRGRGNANLNDSSGFVQTSSRGSNNGSSNSTQATGFGRGWALNQGMNSLSLED